MKQLASQKCEGRTHISTTMIHVVVMLVALTITASGAVVSNSGASLEGTTTAQESIQSDVRELNPGASIERELAGRHSYRVRLTAKQYLKVVVNQKGIDVVVLVFGPEGTEAHRSG